MELVQWFARGKLHPEDSTPRPISLKAIARENMTAAVQIQINERGDSSRVS
jgi:hypothetical protein